MATLPGFKRFPGRNERFLVIATGEEISRRKYDLIRRGISNEALARINKATELSEQLARPARGRKSVLKEPDFVKSVVIKSRIQEKAKREVLTKVAKAQKQIDRKIERARNKKISTPKFSGGLLKAGRKARRVLYSEYDDYLKLYADMKKSGIVFGYSVGALGVDTRTGEQRGAFLFPLKGFDSPIDPDEYAEVFSEWLESHAYIEYIADMLQISFEPKYYEAKAVRAGIKLTNVRPRG